MRHFFLPVVHVRQEKQKTGKRGRKRAKTGTVSNFRGPHEIAHCPVFSDGFRVTVSDCRAAPASSLILSPEKMKLKHGNEKFSRKTESSAGELVVRLAEEKLNAGTNTSIGKRKMEPGNEGFDPELENFHPKIAKPARNKKIRPGNRNFDPATKTSARNAKAGSEDTKFARRDTTSIRKQELPLDNNNQQFQGVLFRPHRFHRIDRRRPTCWYIAGRGGGHE
jgi:hypothetical protein